MSTPLNIVLCNLPSFHKHYSNEKRFRASLNHDVLAVLLTGYGKCLIFQSFVVAKELLNSAKACVLVICPLTSIIQDQIPEAKALEITRVSLHDLEEVTQNNFQLVFSSAERAMEKDFRNSLKDNSSRGGGELLHLMAYTGSLRPKGVLFHASGI